MGVKSPGVPSPFPSITPGAPGFRPYARPTRPVDDEITVRCPRDAAPSRFCLLAGLVAYQQAHQSTKGSIHALLEEPVKDVFQPISITSHLVWGYVPLSGIAAIVVVLECGRLEFRQQRGGVRVRRSVAPLRRRQVLSNLAAQCGVV